MTPMNQLPLFFILYPGALIVSQYYYTFVCNMSLPVELNNFFATLDKRYSEKIKGEGVLVLKKQRRQGSNSSLLPPPGAPSWTLNEAWKGTYDTLFSECVLLFIILFIDQTQIDRRSNPVD